MRRSESLSLQAWRDSVGYVAALGLLGAPATPAVLEGMRVQARRVVQRGGSWSRSNEVLHRLPHGDPLFLGALFAGLSQVGGWGALVLLDELDPWAVDDRKSQFREAFEAAYALGVERRHRV